MLELASRRADSQGRCKPHVILSAEGLGEDVRNVLCSWDMLSDQLPLFVQLPDKEVARLNVFGTC